MAAKDPRPVVLWLDDVRPPALTYRIANVVICRDAQSALDWLELNGPPVVISFDHDLGHDTLTGLTVARWFEEKAAAGALPRFPAYKVHSANPVGAAAIRATMEAAERFFNTIPQKKE